MIGKKPTISESTVQSQVKQYLELMGYKVYRVNNSGTWNESKHCYIFHGTAGVSDLIGFKAGHPALFVECKSPKGKPSPAQVEFLGLVNASDGAIGVCVDNLEALQKNISQKR